MKASWRLFAGLAVFYAMMAGIYYGVGGEALGITAISLSAGLAGLIGFYVWFSDKRIGLLPQDNLDAEIADGAGELGFYSPHSWWPLAVASSMITAGLGLIVGWWLTIIAIAALVVTILGFTLEYEKPDPVSAH